MTTTELDLDAWRAHVTRVYELESQIAQATIDYGNACRDRAYAVARNDKAAADGADADGKWLALRRLSQALAQMAIDGESGAHP